MLGWREVENQSLKASIETIEAAKRRLLAVVFCAGRKEPVMAIMTRMGRGVKMVCVYSPDILCMPRLQVSLE